MILADASPRKRFFLILAAVLVLVLGVCTFAIMRMKGDDRVPGVADVPYEATFSGTSVCLPHKNPDESHTMECALGLKTDEGPYIALDASVLQTESGFDLQDGSHMTVQGRFIPIEYVSTERMQGYDIIGVLQVTSVEKG